MSSKIFPNDDNLVVYFTTRISDYNDTNGYYKLQSKFSSDTLDTRQTFLLKSNQTYPLLLDIEQGSSRVVTVTNQDLSVDLTNKLNVESFECSFAFCLRIDKTNATSSQLYTPVIGLISNYYKSSYSYGMHCLIDNDRANLSFAISDFKTLHTVTIPVTSDFKYDNVNHIVLTYSKEKIYLYINGEKVSQLDRNLSSLSGTNDNYRMYVGTLGDGLSIEKTFQIGEIRLYKNCLTERQIEKLYNLFTITPKIADTIGQSETIFYGINGSGNHPSSFNYSTYKNSLTRVEDFEKLTGFVSNYKFNSNLWFNQSSSFLYQTMNRIPLIEPELEEISNAMNVSEVVSSPGQLSSDLVYKDYVDDHLYRYKNDIYTDTKIITGTPVTKSDISELLVRDTDNYDVQNGFATREYRRDITKKFDLVIREIQNNLGLSIPKRKKYYMSYPTGNTAGSLDRLPSKIEFNNKAELLSTLNTKESKIITYEKLTQEYNSAYNPMFFGYKECSLNEKDPYSFFLCNEITYQTYMRYYTGKPYPSSYTRYNSNVSNGIPSSLRYCADQSNSNAGQMDALKEFNNNWLFSLKLFNHPTHAYDADTLLLADTNRYLKISGEGYNYSAEEVKEPVYYNYNFYKTNFIGKANSPTHRSSMINPYTRFFNYKPVAQYDFSTNDINILLNSYLFSDPKNVFITYKFLVSEYDNQSYINNLPNNRNIPNDAVLFKTLMPGTNENGVFSDTNNEKGYYLEPSQPRKADSNFRYSGMYFKISETNGNKLVKDILMEPITHIEGGMFKWFATTYIDMRSYLYHYDVVSTRKNKGELLDKHFLNHATIDIGPSIDMREYAMNLDNYALPTFNTYLKHRSIIGTSYNNRNGSFNPDVNFYNFLMDSLMLGLSKRTVDSGTKKYYNPIGITAVKSLTTGDYDKPITNDNNISQNIYNTGIYSGTRFNNYNYNIDPNSKLEAWNLSKGKRENYFGNAFINPFDDEEIISKRLEYYYKRSKIIPDPYTDGYYIGYLNFTYSLMSPFNTKMIFMPYPKQYYEGMDNYLERSNNYYHIDFAGYMGQPIDEFNTPVNNGLLYRLGFNQSFRTGLGLTILAEKGNLSKPSLIGHTDYLRTFTHNYSGWGNNQNHTAQRDRMMTTLALSCNARESKYSYFRAIRVNKARKYKHVYNPIDISYDIKHNITLKMVPSDVTDDSTSFLTNFVIDLNLPSERFSGSSVFVAKTNHRAYGPYNSDMFQNLDPLYSIAYASSELYDPLFYKNNITVSSDPSSNENFIPGARTISFDNNYGSKYGYSDIADAVDIIGLRYTDRLDQIRNLFKYANNIKTEYIYCDNLDNNSLFNNSTFKQNQVNRSLFWNERTADRGLLDFDHTSFTDKISSLTTSSSTISIINNGYCLPMMICVSNGQGDDSTTYNTPDYSKYKYCDMSTSLFDRKYVAYFNTMDVTLDLLNSSAAYLETKTDIFYSFSKNTNKNKICQTIAENNINNLVVVSGNSRNMLKIYNHIKYHNDYNGYIVQAENQNLNVSRKKNYKVNKKIEDFKQKIQDTVYKQYRLFFA